MYQFTDTSTETSQISQDRPAEAMKVNGQYLEDLIPGYRTLAVSGRELLVPELETESRAVGDGAVLKKRRYPARTLKVKFQLCAGSDEAFRAAFNTLSGALNAAELELIFDDEPDKCFHGTFSGASGIDPGANTTTGELSFLCCDPFKYSVQEKSLTIAPGSSRASVQYNGVYPARPSFEVQFYQDPFAWLDNLGDCGYVAVTDTKGHSLSFGGQEEEDIDPDASGLSTLLFSQDFNSLSSWDDEAKELWTFNSIPNTTFRQQGNIVNYQFKLGLNAKFCLCQGADQNPPAQGGYGPSMTRNLNSPDCNRWIFRFTPCFSTGKFSDEFDSYGEFAAFVLAEDGSRIAWIRLIKKFAGGSAQMEFNVGDSVIYTGSFYIGDGGPFNPKTDEGQFIEIKCTGQTVTFQAANTVKSYKANNLNSAAKVAFMFSSYAGKPSGLLIGLMNVEFAQSDPYDIQNSFAANDVLKVDCRNASVLLNNTPSPQIGSVANDWEEFQLVPGENTIEFSYSSWVEDAYAPTLTMRYREVYL